MHTLWNYVVICWLVLAWLACRLLRRLRRRARQVRVPAMPVRASAALPDRGRMRVAGRRTALLLLTLTATVWLSTGAQAQYYSTSFAGATAGGDLSGFSGWSKPTNSSYGTGSNAGTMVFDTTSNLNQVHPSAMADGLYLISASSTNADYTVTVTYTTLGTAQTSGYVEAVGRCASDGQSYYMVRYSPGAGGVSLYLNKQDALSAGMHYKQLGTTQTLAWTPGGSHTLSLVMSGTSISAQVDGSTIIGPITDSGVVAAGKAGLLGNQGAGTESDSAGIHVTSFSATNAGAGLTAGTLTTSSVTNTAVGLTTTAATGGTSPYTYTFQRATDMAFTMNVTTIQAASSATTATDSTVTAGTTYYYRVTYTDNVAATINSSVLPVNVPTAVTVTLDLADTTHLYFSPYNWYNNGSSGAAARRITNTSLAYFKMAWSTTSAGTGTIALNFDVSNLTSGDTGTLYWSIDGAAFQSATLASTVSLSSTLSAATHQVIVYTKWTAFGASADCWGTGAGATPATSFVLKSVVLDSNATFGTNVMTGFYAVKNRKILLEGDSITHGSNATSPIAAYAVQLGQALNGEIGIIGFPGQGWTQCAGGADTSHTSSKVLTFPNTYNVYWNGRSRTLGTADNPTPDIWLTNLGTNDAANDVSSAENTFLGNARAAAGSTTKIYCCIPFNANSRTTQISGANTYTAAHPSDTAIGYVDVSGITSLLLSVANNAWLSADGTHPTDLGHAFCGSTLAAAVNNKAYGASGGGKRRIQ